MPWYVPIGLFFASIIVALQSWILLELLRLRDKTNANETQYNRLVSDVESEKDTRARLHIDFETRLRALERRPS